MSSEQQKAKAEQERLSQQLASEQKIAAAQLALRTADTVEAMHYAAQDYAAAGDLLAKAEAALKQGDYAGAQTAADDAKKSADQAAAAAKPLYEQAEESSQNKARNEALARDAPGIPGAKVRIDPRGDLQRLVIVIPEMFTKREPSIAPGHDTHARRGGQPAQEVPELSGPGRRLHRQPRQVGRAHGDLGGAGAGGLLRARRAGRRDQAPHGQRARRRGSVRRQQDRPPDAPRTTASRSSSSTTRIAPSPSGNRANIRRAWREDSLNILARGALVVR